MFRHKLPKSHGPNASAFACVPTRDKPNKMFTTRTLITIILLFLGMSSFTVSHPFLTTTSHSACPLPHPSLFPTINNKSGASNNNCHGQGEMHKRSSHVFSTSTLFSSFAAHLRQPTPFFWLSPSDVLNTLVIGAEASSMTNSSSIHVDDHFTIITFGYFRMTGMDSPFLLASYLAAIRKANVENTVPNVRFHLDVATVHCPAQTCEADLQLPVNKALMKRFIDKFPTYTAVIRPCHFAALQIIDAAVAAQISVVETISVVEGGVTVEQNVTNVIRPSMPVIDPVTVRKKDLNRSNLVIFNEDIRREILQLFTFMQHDSGCAVSGILYGTFSELGDNAAYAKQLFVDGGLPSPKILDVRGATEAQIRDFVIHNSDGRQCYLVIAGNRAYRRAIEALAKDPDFNPATSKMYGISLTSDDRFVSTVTGNALPYAYTTFVRWFPSLAIANDNPNIVLARDAPQILMQWNTALQAGEMTTFTKTIVGQTIVGSPYNDGLNSSSSPTDFSTSFVVDNKAEMRLFSDYSINPFNGGGGGAANQFLPSVLHGLLVINYAIEMVRVAAAKDPSLMLTSVQAQKGATENATHLAFFNGTANSSSPLATVNQSHWWSAFTAASHADAAIIGGYPFNRAVHSCPPKPLEQVCSCNIITTTSHIYAVNGSTGGVYVVWDNNTLGQRDVASVPRTCGAKSTGWSYPITGLSVEPLEFVPRIGFTTQQLIALNALTNRVYGSTIKSINFAPVKPARPYRFALLPVPGTGLDNGTDTDALVNFYSKNYNPFVLLSSMAGSIWKPNVLTLFPSLIEVEEEDPPLKPHDQWAWALLNIRPVLADLIHGAVHYYQTEQRRFAAAAAAMAAGSLDLRRINTSSDEYLDNIAYYTAARLGPFTSFHAITNTNRSAELISMSLATFGYDYPVSNIIISDDQQVWFDTVKGWLSNPSSARPFVLAPTAKNPNDVISGAYKGAVEAKRGTLAVCVFEGKFYAAWQATPMALSDDADILVSTYLREWWLGETYGVPDDLLDVVNHPRYHIVASAIAFMRRLGEGVQYDYKRTAAEVVYAIQTVSDEFGTYGPFYNQTCSADVVARNDPDRRCQCTKGVRDVFVQSCQNWKRGEPSRRTAQHKYTLTTCGVLYKPYIPPEVPFELSAGAIAGIAIAAAAVVISITLAAILVPLLCFRRNNRHAPKDPSQPFSIAFTDIQSATALWARAPQAMSEAVEIHQKVLRSAIHKHDGYEVKTVGDSFMVAFKTADAAVEWAVSAQIMLNKHRWSDEIDATYVELMMEAGLFDEDQNPNIINGDASNAGTATQRSEWADSHINNTNNNPNITTASVHAFDQSQSSIAASAHQHNAVINNNNNIAMMPMQSLTSNAILSGISASQSRHPQIQGTEASNSAAPPSSTHLSTDHFLLRYNDVRGVEASKRRWHGLRVRVGINHGVGEIRKDPVTQGYDYYGTVVNTAARVAGVGHGGQTLITADVYNALTPDPTLFARKKKIAVVNLGKQPLRGLDAPLQLFQVLPESLVMRKFAALRLHIEKQTEEEDESDATAALTWMGGDTETSHTTHTTATGGGGTNGGDSSTFGDDGSPEAIAKRLCVNKQYSTISEDQIVIFYNYLVTLLGPSNAAYQTSLITKLSAAWGLQSNSAQLLRNPKTRTRLLVGLIAKITKSFVATKYYRSTHGGGLENTSGSRSHGGGSTVNTGAGAARKSAIDSQASSFLTSIGAAGGAVAGGGGRSSVSGIRRLGASAAGVLDGMPTTANGGAGTTTLTTAAVNLMSPSSRNSPRRPHVVSILNHDDAGNPIDYGVASPTGKSAAVASNHHSAGSSNAASDKKGNKSASGGTAPPPLGALRSPTNSTGGEGILNLATLPDALGD